ncbi:DUF952 domain-containing protein [Gayadomonas joobiniege]|uniref:DUF952 domain-containing protein n=1 Tax=Gayadomonas joobiniege TaxID=1234606 RepID=UPI00037B0C1F|nr:DUF952 domain-containing protein [Gayadomonas joobiniege]
MQSTSIYVIVSQQEYLAAIEVGELNKPSLQDEGFIHASGANNLTRVANKFYLQTELPILLQVESAEVTAPIKWETAANSLYPHIYGPLNMSAVINAVAIAKNDQGLFELDNFSV